jgi:hypothetical protein
MQAVSVATGPALILSQIAAAAAQSLDPHRNIAEFKALPLGRRRAFLFNEGFEALKRPMSLFGCAAEVLRSARNTRERTKLGLHVGSSSTQAYEDCGWKYFPTTTPAECKVTKATI